jgi:hypothetical protein
VSGNRGVYRWELRETQDPCQAHLRHCSQPQPGSVRQSVRLEGAYVVTKFGSEDKYLLCADGQVHISTY